MIAVRSAGDARHAAEVALPPLAQARAALATRPRAALAAALALALAAVFILVCGPLGALPAVLAFAPLLAGSYPGADRLEKLIERSRPRRLAVARTRPVTRPYRVGPLPRGGRLIGCSLAKRPPPAAPLFS